MDRLQGTRREIVKILKKNGRASVEELGKLLQITPMCVRQHLAILERDGFVKSWEERQKMGRPPLIYALTENAVELFPRLYPQLLAWTIEELKRMDGCKKVEIILERMSDHMARQFLENHGARSFDEKFAAVCEMLLASGSIPEWEASGEGYILHEHNCRYHKVAANHHEICAMELGFLTKVLDADVEMLECVMAGSPHCSYAIHPRPSS